MPIPKYVSKSKHKEYRKKHKEIVEAIEKSKAKVQSPYAVATARLKSQYKSTKKSGKKKSSKRNK